MAVNEQSVQVNTQENMQAGATEMHPSEEVREQSQSITEASQKSPEELQKLDKENRQYIHENFDENIIMEAGAGAGKTKELIDRILMQFEETDLDISQLVAITFTEKATGEMKERFQGALIERIESYEKKPQLGEAEKKKVEKLKAARGHIEQMHISTIHSFCRSILEEHPFEIGMAPGFTILEETEYEDKLLRFVSQYLAEHKERKKAFDELDIVPSQIVTLFQQMIRADYTKADRYSAEELGIEATSSWQDAFRQSKKWMFVILRRIKQIFNKNKGIIDERYNTTQGESNDDFRLFVEKQLDELDPLWPKEISKAYLISPNEPVETAEEGDQQLPDEKGDQQLPDEEGDQQLPDEEGDQQLPDAEEEQQLSDEKEELQLPDEEEELHLPKGMGEQFRSIIQVLYQKVVKKGKFVPNKRGEEQFKKEIRNRLNADFNAEFIMVKGKDKIPVTLSKLLRAAIYSLQDFITDILEDMIEDYQGAACKGLSYDELLCRTRNLLRKHDELRKALQEKYRMIYVDEYQDTDPIQTEILFQLTSETKLEGNTLSEKIENANLIPGRLFCIGDSKQSIYSFRGADVTLFLKTKEKLKASKGSKAIEIYKNFRSSKEICDWVTELFQELFQNPAQDADQKGEERINEASGIVFQGMVTDRKGKEEEIKEAIVGEAGSISEEQQKEIDQALGRTLCGVYPCILEDGNSLSKEELVRVEADHIARMIRQMIDRKLQILEKPDALRGEKFAALRPVRAEDFMILTPKKQDLYEYAGALTRQNIPVRISGKSPFQSSLDYANLIRILDYLMHPQDLYKLSICLSFVFGISLPPGYDLSKLSKKIRQPLKPFLSEQSPKEVEDEWMAVLKEPAQRLWELFQEKKKILATYNRRSPLELIEMIADDYELLKGVEAGFGEDEEVKSLPGEYRNEKESGNDSKSAVEEAYGVMELAMDYLRNKNIATLEQALELLQALKDGKSRIETALTLDTSQEGVRVMNLHKSKGLEAKIVILAYGDDKSYGDNIKVVVKEEQQKNQGSELQPALQGSEGQTPENQESEEQAPEDQGSEGQQPWEAVAYLCHKSQNGLYCESAGFQEHASQKDFGEKIRLLYVAATRAQEALILPMQSYSVKKEKSSGSYVFSWEGYWPSLFQKDPCKSLTEEIKTAVADKQNEIKEELKNELEPLKKKTKKDIEKAWTDSEEYKTCKKNKEEKVGDAKKSYIEKKMKKVIDEGGYFDTLNDFDEKYTNMNKKNKKNNESEKKRLEKEAEKKKKDETNEIVDKKIRELIEREAAKNDISSIIANLEPQES